MVPLSHSFIISKNIYVLILWYQRCWHIRGNSTNICVLILCYHRCWHAWHIRNKNMNFKEASQFFKIYFFARRYRPYIVQESQVGLEVNGTHELLIYADGVKLLSSTIHTHEKHRNSRRCQKGG